MNTQPKTSLEIKNLRSVQFTYNKKLDDRKIKNVNHPKIVAANQFLKGFDLTKI